eukprot:gene7464-5260_t
MHKRNLLMWRTHSVSVSSTQTTAVRSLDNLLSSSSTSLRFASRAATSLSSLCYAPFGTSSMAVLPYASSGRVDTSAVHCARRGLFGFFSSPSPEKTRANGKRCSSSSSPTDATASSSSPIREAALEPMQDRLLQTCVELLEMAGGAADGRPPLKEVDSASREVFFDLVDAVLHDYTKTPAQQFELVYAALCLPAAQQHLFVRRALMVVLEAVAPAPLHQLMSAVDLSLPEYDEESVIRRAAVIRLGRALMGGLEELAEEEAFGDASKRPEDALTEEEVLLVYLDDFKKAFPSACRAAAFELLERNAATIALKSQLFTLLGRLCREMDSEQSGKIRLEDLQSLAKRVLGEEKAKMLLDGAVADAEGKLRYAQLCALLTRAPPPPSLAAAAAATASE